MKVKFITLISIFLTACVSRPIPEKPNNSEFFDSAFKVEFGKIVEVGEFYEIRPDSLDFELEDGYKIYQVPVGIESKFGIRIENIDRKAYNLAFYIGVWDDKKGAYLDFSKGGYWYIAPPINEDYEAFVWENDKHFLPGYYKFVVMIDKGKVLTVINFKVN